MDPLTLLALAAMAGGSYMQYQANTEAMKRQKNASALAAQDQLETIGKKNKIALERAEDFAPKNRIERKKQIIDQNTKSMQNDLVAARDAGDATIEEAGGRVSNDYETTRARTIANELARASDYASKMAKFRAPTDLRFNEGIDNMNIASDIDTLSAIQRARGGVWDNAIRHAGTVDPKKQFLGNLLSSVGSAGVSGRISSGALTGGATSGAGIAGSSKPWWDITSGPRKLGFGT